MLAKARELEVDEVILDLEDAVAAAEKTDATRGRVAAALSGAEWTAKTRAVRVNAVSTPWCLGDITRVVEGAGAALDCIVVPKVERASELHFVSHLLDQLEGVPAGQGRIGIEVLIESPRALVEIERIGLASPRLEALVFGPGDYAAALGTPQLGIGALDEDYPGDQWHYVRSRIATAAAAFDLQAVDGPYAALDDPDGLLTSARRAAVLGFEGKWAIHPEQIAVCNDVFSPSQDEFDAANELLATYAVSGESGAGAIRHRGEMVDEASRRLAERVIARGRAAGLQRS